MNTSTRTLMTLHTRPAMRRWLEDLERRGAAERAAEQAAKAIAATQPPPVPLTRQQRAIRAALGFWMQRNATEIPETYYGLDELMRETGLSVKPAELRRELIGMGWREGTVIALPAGDRRSPANRMWFSPEGARLAEQVAPGAVHWL